MFEKEGIVMEVKKMVDEKVDDILVFDESFMLVDVEKYEKLNEKLIVEWGLEKVDVNCIYIE